MRKYSIGVFFNVWTSDFKKWQDQAEFIKRLRGVEHVEILLEDVDPTSTQLHRLSKLLKPYKKIVHAPFMNISILSPHKEIVEASLKVCQKAAKITKKLGADTMTFHLETYPNYYSEIEAQEQAQKIINRFSKNTGLKIAIENISYGGKTRLTYPSNPQQFYKLSRVLRNSVGFTLDIGHFLKDEFDPIAVVKHLKNRIFDIHLHDGRKGKAHLELGKGALNIKKLISNLEKINYGGFLTLEVMGEKETLSSWRTLKDILGNN